MGRKVVYNTCYGGFGLSPIAEKKLYEKKNPGKIAYVYKELFPDNYEERSGDERYVKVDPETPEEDASLYILSHDFGDSFIISEEEKKNNSGNYKIFNDSFIWIGCSNIERHDPDLVAIVEELGEKADGYSSRLKVIDIGDEKYHINNYDGVESVITNLGDNYWH